MTGFPSKDRPWLKYYCEAAPKATIPSGSIYDYLCEMNRDVPDSIAIEYLGWTITYSEFFEMINQAAAAFQHYGVKEGDIVSLAIPNIPENVIAIYALNKIGAISNMVDLRLSGEELERYFNEVESKVIVVCDLFLHNTLSVLDQLQAETVIVCSPFDHLPLPIRWALKKKAHVKIPKGIDGLITWKDFVKGPYEPAVDRHTLGSATASILHTSGTTGNSKGVMLSNRSFNALAVEYQYIYGEGHFKADERIMNQVPPFLAYNVILSMHTPLTLHLRLVLLPNYEPEKYAENILKYKPQHVTAGPADWENFLDNPVLEGKDLSFLRTIASGSDTIRYDIKKKIDALLAEHGSPCSIIEGYGMTEVGCAATTNHYDIDVPGSVGVPYPFVNICIYDNENQKELSYHEKGEICISGPRLMNGYYNNPAATEEVMQRHDDGIVWMHSGDLGYLDENGFLFLDGRLKRIIIQHNGMKINPFEVERAILSHPDVKFCCVVGHPDKEHGRGFLPAAYFVMEPDCKLSPDELIAEVKKTCEEKLAERYQPQWFYVLPELPLTPNGKVDYRKLESEAQ